MATALHDYQAHGGVVAAQTRINGSSSAEAVHLPNTFSRLLVELSANSPEQVVCSSSLSFDFLSLAGQSFKEDWLVNVLQQSAVY